MALVHLPRELLESLGFVTWELEMPAARFLSLGRNVESLAGRTPEEILATPDPWLLLVHPDDRERIDTELRRTADGEQPRIFRVRPAPTLAFEGELRLAAGVSESTDRTTRITGLLDPVFRSIATQLEHVESVAQVGSWEWRIDADEVLWSAELYRIFGIPEDTPIDYAKYREMLHPEDRQLADDTIESSLASGEPYQFDHRVVRPDGETRWVRGRGRVVTDDGGPVKMLGTSQDITLEVEAQREKTRAARAEAVAERKELERQRLRDIFSESPSPIVVTHGPTHTIQLANESFRELTGQPELEGRPLPEIPFLLPAEGMESVLNRVYSRGEAVRREEVSYRPRRESESGSELFFNFVCQPLRRDDGVYGVLFQAVDVTALVRSRHELEETARTLARLTRNLSRKNQELDQFAYVASHDLKAPLRGIHSLSQWIEEDLGDRVDDQSREHLRLLRSRVQRMESLIDALLQYSRVGRGEREIETVDVAQLVREVVDLLSPPAYTTVRIADLPVLEAERLPLRQVFHNLIGNAIKFNSSDEPRVEIGCRRDNGDHRFWVRDNGPGIPERLQSRIWGMFQTLQSRDEIEGAGMGLALVRKIVHDRGGSVELESEEGKGSTFSFTWPEVPEPDTESSVTPYTREGQEPVVMP